MLIWHILSCYPAIADSNRSIVEKPWSWLLLHVIIEAVETLDTTMYW